MSDDQSAISADRLRQVISKIERLEEDKAALAADIRDVYAEAKGSGFDTRILRKIVSLRRKKDQERREEEELLDLYKAALGME